MQNYDGGFPWRGGEVYVDDKPGHNGRYGFKFHYPGDPEPSYEGSSARKEDAVHECLALVRGREPLANWS